MVNIVPKGISKNLSIPWRQSIANDCFTLRIQGGVSGQARPWEQCRTDQRQEGTDAVPPDRWNTGTHASLWRSEGLGMKVRNSVSHKKC